MRNPAQCADGDCAIEVAASVVVSLDPGLGLGPLTLTPSESGVTILGIDSSTNDDRGCPVSAGLGVSIPGMPTDLPVTLSGPGACRSQRGLVFLVQEPQNGHPVLQLYRTPTG